jgi:hypothetical protein
VETSWSPPTTASSPTLDRGPGKPRKRKATSRTMSDDELVRLLTRRTGRSHERWLPLLAAARAARAPASRPQPSPKAAIRPRNADDLEKLLADLAEGPLDLGAWHVGRGLSKPEAYKLLRSLRRRGHRIERESRSGKYELLSR